MRTHNVIQGSEEWFRLRAGIITCSELDSLLTPSFKPRDSKGVESYVARKVAERWTGGPLQTFSGGAAEQGSILEGEAVPWLAWSEGIEIERVGFITTDDSTFGCSPDGIVRDGTSIIGTVEAKCPEPQTHTKYLIEGGVPVQYITQVQGAMFATGAKWAKFVSYCKGFPSLVVHVPRVHSAMLAIEDAVKRVNAKIDAGYALLVEKNGGEPERRGHAKKFKAQDYSGPIDEELLKSLY